MSVTWLTNKRHNEAHSSCITCEATAAEQPVPSHADATCARGHVTFVLTLPLILLDSSALGLADGKEEGFASTYICPNGIWGQTC